MTLSKVQSLPDSYIVFILVATIDHSDIGRTVLRHQSDNGGGSEGDQCFL